MTIYSDVNREAGRHVHESRVGASSSSSVDDVVDPVNLKEDNLWRNLSIARVDDDGNKGCFMGTGVVRCAWEAAYFADLPSSKPSFAASTLWSLALVPGDDWEAVLMATTNGSLKALREMNRSFELLCNFPFLMNPICKRTGVMR
jgi:hypothetical protein